MIFVDNPFFIERYPHYEPKKIIFNPPATIVYWTDGTKTVVKCSPHDTYNKRTGFIFCFIKRMFNNNSNKFNKFIKTWYYGLQKNPCVVDMTDDKKKKIKHINYNDTCLWFTADHIHYSPVTISDVEFSFTTDDDRLWVTVDHNYKLFNINDIDFSFTNEKSDKKNSKKDTNNSKKDKKNGDNR